MAGLTTKHVSRVDAELANGADVNVTGTTSTPAGAKLGEIAKATGVRAAVRMMHRYAYVGADLQDLSGIEPAAIGRVTTMANAYFANGDAKPRSPPLLRRRTASWSRKRR